MKVLTVADFFCGGGGFSEGFRQKGFEIVFGLDNWKPAIDTHSLNHPETKDALTDILELTSPEKIDAVVPDTDVIIGSPPCVSFSYSNKSGKADKTLGTMLIEAYLRIVAWKLSKGRLKYWILENVPNSAKYINEKYTWKELGLPGKGPDLLIPTRAVLNSADFGVPQTRKRFFCGKFPLPKPTHTGRWIKMREVMDKLGDPLDGKNNETIPDPVYGFSIARKMLTDHFYDTRVEEFEWKRAKRLKTDHGFMGVMSFPEDTDRPSRTVMATRSASTREAILIAARGGGYRLPTIREIASFMAFPINYQFEASSEEGKYRLVGNAVPAKMAAALAEAILKEEGLKDLGYVPLSPKRLSAVDLTGSKRLPKPRGRRRPDAWFALHVPDLKIRGVRAELTNGESDFGKSKVVWSCELCRGSGKNHIKKKIDNKVVRNMLASSFGFESFQTDIMKELGRLKLSHSSFQEAYSNNDDVKGPEAILDLIKELVDRHFPERECHDAEIQDEKDRLGIGRGRIPLRVLAALYACNAFVNSLEN